MTSAHQPTCIARRQQQDQSQRRQARRRRCNLAAILGLTTILQGALQGCRPGATSVDLAMVPWPGYEYYVAAHRQKLYNEKLTRIRFFNFQNQAQQIDAYINGRANAIAITSVDAVAICGVAPDRCPVVVQVIDESRGADQLVARQPIQTLQQLQNQPIALERSGLARYMLVRAFQTAGLPPPSLYRLKYMPQGQWLQALRAGTVQAVITYPPQALELKQALKLNTLFSSRDLRHEILDVLAVEPELLRRRPEAVAELIRGWRRAFAQAHANHDSTRAEPQIQYPGLQEEYQLLDPEQNNLKPRLERIRDVLDAAGMLPANTPLPRSSLAPLLQLSDLSVQGAS